MHNVLFVLYVELVYIYNLINLGTGVLSWWNATELIWTVLASSNRISSWTPLKPQHSNPNPNPNPLANQLWCIDFLTPPTPLVSFEVISSGCNALVVPFQQLLEGPMEVLLCEHVNDPRQSLFHLLNSLITTASELRK